jgi:succinate dehydrogenase / fumarate reductase cytochrome b subunit
MATTVIQNGQPGSHARFRDSFVLHKLHSLSGVVPIGFFMVFHLLANSYSLRGEAEFNTVVKVIGYLPFVFIVELAVIFVPILFHAIYGLIITSEMQGPGGNMAYYGYGRNWLYWLQRVSGIVALCYICYHVYSTTGHRWMYELTGGDQGHDEGFRAIAYEAMAWRFAGLGYTLFYIVGITAACFHFGNGLFNFCIRWGLTIGNQAQKISAAIWIAVGIALAFVGIWTAVNFHNLGVAYRLPGGDVVNLRQKYDSLDDLVKDTSLAPAAPILGAKPAPAADTHAAGATDNAPAQP